MDLDHASLLFFLVFQPLGKTVMAAVSAEAAPAFMTRASFYSLFTTQFGQDEFRPGP
ncbi:hypothetical protein Dbac_1939 [Desulfomicrobium baculatum DSM 4028]|uniref:Uncharacterized protein n=1 Tax=Desulfomicrobium baculatum (strain DSM 4028 / VKM B-1378 / X) TaxID=525897 RepID=C7LXF7_DESBD|nr:hypothetical protein Dbac_1939 [Desulfomicrobium baculatum DSM 4028]